MQFHILSLEGPDPYARAGGIATRVSGMAAALAEQGFDTHLWFVGDPDQPASEVQGRLTLHRWCQWISRYHPVGVYDGEDAKERDFAASLPPHLIESFIAPARLAGEAVVVMAEEWHTAHAVLHLDWLLRRHGLRGGVPLFWTANNVFGFERIDWRRLNDAAVIATVSRYMRERMRPCGVNALVLPNGISAESFVPAETAAVRDFAQLTNGRATLTKMARWDPDKRWVGAIESVAALRRAGARPFLIARGGSEAHGEEVLAHARSLGLQVSRQRLRRAGGQGLLKALQRANGSDVVMIDSHVDADARRLLFHASDAVLANSVHEPFGLVGLEAMAVGGLACTGCTGEDYAIPGENAIALQTNDPRELAAALSELRANPSREREVRREGRRTAQSYYWPRVIERSLLPQVQLETGSRLAA